MGTLEGVRVLDFAQGYGAIVAMLLADEGADVVKVEPPGGERFRGRPAFLQWNRGKRGIELDLRTDEGRRAGQRLAAGVDVVVENFRPGVADRLGIDYDQLAAVNPGLVHLSISGFGSRDPLAGIPAYEGIVAAKTGQYVIQNGYRDGGPIYDAVFKCSFGAAMLGVIGVLAALHARRGDGRGQKVETSLAQANFVYSYDGARGETEEISEGLSHKQGRDPHNVMPGYRIARCADGRWIQSGSANGKILHNMMRALGIDAFFAEERLRKGPRDMAPADQAELLALIDAAYERRPLDEWLRVLEEHDAGFAPFMSTQELMDHPQIRHNGMVIDVDDPTVGPMQQIGPLVTFLGRPWVWPGPAPRPGEHTAEVLAEATAPTSGDGAGRVDVDRNGGKPVSGRSGEARGALDGVTIVDLSMYAAAPGGPGLLTDLGARCVKVEPPGGDPLGLGHLDGGELFFRVNRGKDRVCIDLKHPAGQAVLHRLVERADVVVHNFRPGVPERLGLDAATLRAVNPRLVYVYAASFGSSGPDAHRPAFDAVISAMAGGEVLQAGEGNPPQQRQTTDHSGLLAVALAILLGLRARDITGQAQELETTMLGSAAYLFSDDFLRYEGKPDRLVPDRGQHGLHALYRLYRAAGGWVFLACTTQAEWEALCRATGRVELADPRFEGEDGRSANGAELAEVLGELFAERDAGTWEDELVAAGVPCVRADGTWPDVLFGDRGPGRDQFTVPFDHPGIGRVEQAGAPVDLARTPARIGRPQVVGESTCSVLAELGYSADEIAALQADGVVVDAQPVAVREGSAG